MSAVEYGSTRNMQDVETAAAAGRGRHSLLSGLFLGLGLAGLVFVAVSPHIIREYNIGAGLYRGVHLSLAIVLGGFFIAMYLTVHAQAYRLSLAGFVCVAVLYCIFFEGRLVSYSVLIPVGVLSVILYEDYPLNMVFSSAFVGVLSAVFMLVQVSQSQQSAYGTALWAVTTASGILLSVLGSLLGRARNELELQQALTERLSANVLRLTEANVSALSFAASVEDTSREEERSRLTREIHDLVGYTLTTNITLMEAVRVMAGVEPARIPEYVETLRQNTEDALSEVRGILRDLRSHEDEDLNILDILSKLKRVYSFSTGVDVVFEYGNVDLESLERHRETIHHFVQEALINAFRHGKATRVIVFFWRHPDDLETTVEDDGVGASTFEEDIGIKGMRERAARLNGRVVIPRVGLGFKIKMTLPMDVKYGRTDDQVTDSG